MARRAAPPGPQPANLTVDQMRRGIDRLKLRTADLEAFDPRSVQQRWGPEIKALQTSIEETLAAVFGHNTVEYNRYRGAARLDQGPIDATPDWISARSGGLDGGLERVPDLQRANNRQAILLLKQAVRGLEEEISARGDVVETASGDVIPAVTLDLSKIFVVHGHEGAPKAEVARFIEELGFEAVILHERPNKGRALITKFSEEAAGVGFAVALMTPDDLGKAKDTADLRYRARQNVVFELSFFIGKLGPERVAALVKGEIELPSDYDGVVYISLDNDDWQRKLGVELQEAGYKFDWNTVMRR